MPRSLLIRDLMTRLNEEQPLKVGHCPKKLNAVIDCKKFPVWLKQLLWWNWINKHEYLFPPGYFVYSVAEIMGYRELDRYLAEQLLPIGSTGNGDEIVIR